MNYMKTHYDSDDSVQESSSAIGTFLTNIKSKYISYYYSSLNKLLDFKIQSQRILIKHKVLIKRVFIIIIIIIIYIVNFNREGMSSYLISRLSSSRESNNNDISRYEFL